MILDGSKTSTVRDRGKFPAREGQWLYHYFGLRDVFAWKDGFRPARTTEAYPGGSYDLMIRYYRAAAKLPWAGDIIYWKIQQPLNQHNS
jgi:hypothetical protein